MVNAIPVNDLGRHNTPVMNELAAGDITPESMLVDIDCLETRPAPRTRAIIATHLYGRMVNMPRLGEVVSKAGAVVIEDCAQAHGGSSHGRPWAACRLPVTERRCQEGLRLPCFPELTGVEVDQIAAPVRQSYSGCETHGERRL